MIKSFIAALALTTLAATGIVGQAQAKTQAGTHLMWVYPPKAAVYAVRHENGKCPNMPWNANR